MMWFIHVAVAVLSLLPGGQSAPVTSCENLIQPIPIKEREQLLGKWIFSAESTNIRGSSFLTKMFVESAWTKITAANKSDAINVVQTQKMFERCLTLSTEMTLANNTLTMVKPVFATEVLLNTGCPDCLVVYSNYTIGGNTYSGLQLLSRRNKVTTAELEEFLKQVDCLSLPQPAILDSEKGLCPDESPSQETETLDLTSVMNVMDSEVFNIFDRIFSSDDGVKSFVQMISSAIAELK